MKTTLIPPAPLSGNDGAPVPSCPPPDTGAVRDLLFAIAILKGRFADTQTLLEGGNANDEIPEWTEFRDGLLAGLLVLEAQLDYHFPHAIGPDLAESFEMIEVLESEAEWLAEKALVLREQFGRPWLAARLRALCQDCLAAVPLVLSARLSLEGDSGGPPNRPGSDRLRIMAASSAA